MKDNLSDMLTRIRNGQKAHLSEILLFWPTPKLCIKILEILQKEGFIKGFNKKINNDKIFFNIYLKYDLNEKPLIKKIYRISKISQRFFNKTNLLWKVNTGKGIYIISTTKGLMTDVEARFLNLGGEVLLYVE